MPYYAPCKVLPYYAPCKSVAELLLARCTPVPPAVVALLAQLHFFPLYKWPKKAADKAVRAALYMAHPSERGEAFLWAAVKLQLLI